jgi:SAM-dependent methyltransferase
LIALTSGDAVNEPKLYRELSEWWPLLSAPEDYSEAAALYRCKLIEGSSIPISTVLELGSGGGSNASHLKAHFKMTLVDASPGMLEVSRRLNPECEHIRGDMRTVRLERLFDAVFVHDAVGYMKTEDDLRAAILTAFVHCRPGGVALFAPDYLRENFKPSTNHGGHDGDGQALRYLEWTWDPDPLDSDFVVDFAYLLRERDGSVRIEYDRHIQGLFGRDDWLRWLAEVGFHPSIVPLVLSDVPPGQHEMFVARRPA